MKALIIINIFSILLGYYREIFIINEFGISHLTDMYVLINRIVIGINLELYLVFSSFFILNISSKKNHFFYKNFAKFTLLISIVQTLLLLVNIYNLGELNLMIVISIILLSLLPFFTIAISYYRAMYEVHKQMYLYGGSLKLTTSFFIILILAIFDKSTNLLLISLAIFSAYFMLFIWGKFFITIKDEIINFKLSIIEVYNESTLHTLIKFAIISNVIMVIDIYALSLLDVGSLSIFNYSSLFYVLLLYFYTNGIVAYYFPKLAKKFNGNNVLEIRQQIKRIIVVSVVIYIPIILFAYLLLDDAVLIIFSSNIDTEKITKTAYLLFVLVIPTIFKEMIKIYFRIIDMDYINVKIQYIYMFSKILFVIPLTLLYGWSGFLVSFMFLNLLIPIIYVYKFINIKKDSIC